jgi:DNA-binding response OmpR family regulator
MLINDRLEMFKDEVVTNKPAALLLDIELLELNCSHEILSLRSLSTETKIIILSGDRYKIVMRGMQCQI